VWRDLDVEWVRGPLVRLRWSLTRGLGVVLIGCRRTPPRFQFIVMNRRSTGECGLWWCKDNGRVGNWKFLMERRLTVMDCWRAAFLFDFRIQ
jgi:hypothetical protein